MSGRRTPRTGAYIPGPPSKAKRDRKWEEQQRYLEGRCVVTFRKIPTVVRDEINLTAARLYVNRDEVARALLEYGIEALQDGLLELKPVLVKGKFVLYEE